MAKLPTDWEVVETIDGQYMALFRGYQQFGTTDPALGCGTQVFSTEEEAEQAIYLCAFIEEERKR